MNAAASPVVRIAVSSCLLGQRVRYDGGDKRDTFVTESLARAFTLVPVCPEVAIGLGVPRPPIELHGDTRAPRARIQGDAARDITAALSAYGALTANALADIAGYVFKSRSPSCALTDARVSTPDGAAVGRGVFAQAFTEKLPDLPCEDEARLRDPGVREGFVEQILAYARWRALMRAGLAPGALVAFHSAHKFTLMAHGDAAYRALGRRIARAGARDIEAFAADYLHAFMAALRTPATRGRHTDVLMHLLGFFKREIDAERKRTALEAIDAYRRGETSRREPLALLRALLAEHPHAYLATQSYLDPLPVTLVEIV